MKKLIIILIAAVSFNAASAQSRNDRYQQQDRKQVTQTRDNQNYHDQYHSNDYAYNNNRQKDDRNRQAEYDRINRQYDQRINGYRNDRSINVYERDRRIHEAEQQRQQSLKSFGGGAIIGGIAGFLLGVLVTH